MMKNIHPGLGKLANKAVKPFLSQPGLSPSLHLTEMGKCFTRRIQGVAENWRLMLALLVAAILHLLVIAFLPLPRVIPFTQPIVPELNVHLAPVILLPRNNRVTLSKEAPVPKTKNARPTRKMPTILPKSAAKKRFDPLRNRNMPPAVVNLEQTPVTASSPPSLPPSPSPPSIESVFDSVKGIVRDEVTRMAPPKEEETDGPVLPELAKALAKALKKQKAGETRFADGLIKIVTPSGKALCYTPLPDIVARGGPIEPTIVPTNCP